MELELLRISSQKDETLGVLFDITQGRQFLCFVLEDEFRTKKVYKQTRIPSGLYKITLRTVGGFHARYQKHFPDMHRGMLWLRNVPNFEYILIHIGNKEDDTAGCLLVGEVPMRGSDGKWLVGRSSKAYIYVYQYIVDAITTENVWITVTDYDRPEREMVV